MLYRNQSGSTESRCRKIRHTIVEMSYAAKSAHLGSSLSCVEILDAMVATSNLRPDTVHSPTRDRIVVSKGHAAMAYYAVLHAWGMIEDRHIEVYLSNGTSLWGHVTRTGDVPAIDFSTGSLGHGLGYATGLALGQRLRRHSGRVFCLLSDGECDEGSVWEAALFAGHHKLSNLTAVVDYNKIQSIGTTAEVLDLEPFGAKWSSFRWDVKGCDGHDSDALTSSLMVTDAPKIVLADTVKGKGIARIENTVASHYRPATGDDRKEFE
ncbi:transketolase [Hyphomicrobium sp. D-2]|uniref:transketolase n=1 Tax=Hyphomicrobium sp. D-2 TaxID=3041621 RepID=UPI002454A2F7|nr:transketolase [Hyphomicrobium sp. D-2]MDH4981859.1 transketolase [Hyphomicrobium sp. D-2]